MRNKLLMSLGYCVFISIVSVFSQNIENPMPALSNRNPNQKQERTLPNTQRGERQKSNPRSNNYFPFKVKRDKEQEQRLKPNPDDLTKHATFLKDSKTGIFRLFNDLDCESNVYVIKVDEACQSSIPGGAFYSFREKEYTTAYLADIRFKQGLLISDGALSQNMLVNLGDMPLENVSLETDGIKYLTGFVPETVNTSVSRQFVEIVKGVKDGKHEYRKVLPAFNNTTYALRVIAYRGSFYRNFRGWIFNLLEGDKRVDVIITFRIIRKDEDGNVTILWKELDRKKSPKMEYEKKNKKNQKPAPVISNKTMAEG